ncbi:MAG TPA: efflux RND transporter periplasmic adaptor subunit [Candidatus Cybelea sp.]|nr:efflux RND transporter periplasmic adaptor subunit [Candidatus Cybelea sp.]
MKKPIPLLLILALAWLATSCERHEFKKPADIDYYTCTMHPSVRSQVPGKCPICGMTLVPVKIKTNGLAAASAPDAAPHAVEFNISLNRQQLIGVTYATVETRPLQFNIRTVGVVAYDPLRRWSYVSRVEGYVEKLEVSSAGQQVAKEQPLLTLYSPDLLVAERELVDLLQSLDRAKSSDLPAAIDNAQQNIAAARKRLAFWNIDDAELDRLEKTRRPVEYLTLFSPFQGVVQTLPASQGRRVMAGDPLVEVVDLSAVWVWVDFYQDDLPLLTNGLPVTLTSETDPGWRVESTVTLIDPFLDAAKRTCRARVDLPNPGLKLRPDMYVNAEVHVELGQGLAVPVSAVLPTGERNYVFVDKGAGNLEPRVVELGRQGNGFYTIRKGLAAGERVAASALFLIDAEAKVQGALAAWSTP